MNAARAWDCSCRASWRRPTAPHFYMSHARAAEACSVSCFVIQNAGWHEAVAFNLRHGSPLVLVVDDEPDLVELVTLTLSRMQLGDPIRRRRGKREETAQGAELRSLPHRHASARRRRARPARMDGTRTARRVPCAVITAHGNVESAVRALKLGAFDFVSKPLDLGVLRRIVSTALKVSRVGESGATTRTGTQLIGNRRRWNDCAM